MIVVREPFLGLLGRESERARVSGRASQATGRRIVAEKAGAAGRGRTNDAQILALPDRIFNVVARRLLSESLMMMRSE